jgi:hypothetical protein
MVAGAAFAVSLSWLPFAHHHSSPKAPKAPKAHKVDKHIDMRNIPGAVGGARYIAQSGAVLIPATVRDRGPYLFMLDTASPHSSIDYRTADQAGIQFWGENASPPATAKEPVARRLQSVSFDVGKAQLFSAEPHALYKPFNLAGSARGRLGMDVMKGYIIRIDPRYRLASVYDPLRFTRPINSVALPLSVSEDGLYVPITIRLKDGSAVTRQARLDTSLTWTMADDAATISQIASVDLGGWNVPQAAGSGPGVGAPAIGMGLLNGYIVTIDVPDRVLFLQSAGRYKPDFAFTARVKADGTVKPRKKKRFIIF